MNNDEKGEKNKLFSLTDRTVEDMVSFAALEHNTV
jgi:hypothetical protein